MRSVGESSHRWVGVADCFTRHSSANLDIEFFEEYSLEFGTVDRDEPVPELAPLDLIKIESIENATARGTNQTVAEGDPCSADTVGYPESIEDEERIRL
ncbi:hypothetical protein HALLA_00100 (plasmid) [Halostagnicola larsenii XH-48]|uniref:Uncharacterized protein n=1 Tax=Halostagnicola larsenii XH-48 TaxID=797299 RepID=W0JT06_9EURY|nr:hypothetical protein HALLA_00100 [Halostagnicola larsenii XH-48]